LQLTRTQIEVVWAGGISPDANPKPDVHGFQASGFPDGLDDFA
jgi:hypothetical protein